MYFVYIIQSEKTQDFYKGLTKNLDQRLEQHNNGKSKSTKNFSPFKLVHVEICESREKARAIEKFFKSGYEREIIKEINKSVPRWRNWQTR